MKGAPHVVSYFQIPIPHASFASLRTTATHVRCTRFYGCSFSHVAFPGPSPIAKKLFNVHAYSTERDLELERAGYGGIWDLQYPTRSWSWAALPGPRGRCQRKRGLCYEACRMPNGVVALSACCRLADPVALPATSPWGLGGLPQQGAQRMGESRRRALSMATNYKY
eukprot:scaffold234137_cov24-Tisochrysis_lutea.AAC.2